MTSMKTMLLAATLALAGVGVMIGCDGDDAPATPAPAQPTAGSAAALPGHLFLAKAPDGAVELAAAKKSAKPGDEVIVRGRVAGSENPLAPNRAILTLLDASVKTCEQMPGDSCATPWDACCEPRETLQANTATVQVVDADGNPVKATLRGAGGIDPLKEGIVVGKVADASDKNTLVINATAFYVKG
jgi:hypothetical protein